jgi:hypothetical protein
VPTGPVEYLVIGFPDSHGSDQIAPELADLVDKKIIRILDMDFVPKDTYGVDILELDDIEDMVGFAAIDGEVGGLIGPEDIDFVADGLKPGSAAVVLLVEDLWEAPLADAVDPTPGTLGVSGFLGC